MNDRYIDAMDSLRKQGLITADPEVKDFESISIHRLVQSAFRKFLTRIEYQELFELTVRLIYRAFPKQREGNPLHLEWSTCRTFIQHGTWLADVYENSQGSSSPLQASKVLGPLLHNCAW
jgi:hypothetical protein